MVTDLKKEGRNEEAKKNAKILKDFKSGKGMTAQDLEKAAVALNKKVQAADQAPTVVIMAAPARPVLVRSRSLTALAGATSGQREHLGQGKGSNAVQRRSDKNTKQ